MLAVEGYVIGLEIGGRGRRVALADLQGKIMAERLSPGVPDEPGAVIDDINSMLQACLADTKLHVDRILRIGCGFSGPVEVGSGIIHMSHRYPAWDGLPLASLLEEKLGAQTLVDNDARVAALGEARFGAGRGEPHLAYIHLGSGLGGGLVIDGRLYHGTTTTAGEFGHMLMTEDGPLCSCGKPGHLEAYASGTAIVQRTLALASQHAATGPLGERLARGNNLTPADIFEAARDGDETARHVTGEAVHYLGIALANIVTTLNPGIIVVGGQVADAGPLLFQPLHSLVRRYAMDVPGRAVRVAPAVLKRDGILIGAVALALGSLAWG